jgi:hypothetical protein
MDEGIGIADDGGETERDPYHVGVDEDDGCVDGGGRGQAIWFQGGGEKTASSEWPTT